jgi:hypothetical protein
MVFEKRRHPRVHVRWPAIVETRRGPIEVNTRNISVGGAFIEYSERADLEDNFAIVFKPSEEQTFSVVGEKVWCGNINIDGHTTYGGLGIRFARIAFEDQEYISTLTGEASEDSG